MNRLVASGPGLVIGVPTLGRPVNLEWAWAFKSMTPPMNYNANIVTTYGKPVDEARNFIVEEAKKLKAKYLFFLGDDVVIPAHTLRQLIFRMEHDETLGIVGGIYFSKCEPSAPLVFRGNGNGSYWDWKVGEYFDITGIGMDATLIRMSVFDKLEKPYFKTVNEDKFLDGVNHADMWTEDLWFCKNVIEKTDYKIYADASIICPHFDIYSGKTYSIPANSLPTRKVVTEKTLQALDIGCGPINRGAEFQEYDLLRVDIDERWNPDYRCDVRSLPFDTGTFDLVFSSHVLEHFNHKEFDDVLTEWLRVLKIGGKLRMVLPTIEWAAEQIINGVVDDNVMNVLYGAQTSPYDFHYNGFTPKTITKVLEGHDLSDIIVTRQENGYNMFIEAKK